MADTEDLRCAVVYYGTIVLDDWFDVVRMRFLIVHCEYVIWYDWHCKQKIEEQNMINIYENVQ